MKTLQTWFAVVQALLAQLALPLAQAMRALTCTLYWLRGLAIVAGACNYQGLIGRCCFRALCCWQRDDQALRVDTLEALYHRALS
jgi:hypothetical protein